MESRSHINKKQQDKLDELFKTGQDLHILVMNVALVQIKVKTLHINFVRSHKSLMAIDESNDNKKSKSKKNKEYFRGS